MQVKDKSVRQLADILELLPQALRFMHLCHQSLGDLPVAVQQPGDNLADFVDQVSPNLGVAQLFFGL